MSKLSQKIQPFLWGAGIGAVLGFTTLLLSVNASNWFSKYVKVFNFPLYIFTIPQLAEPLNALGNFLCPTPEGLTSSSRCDFLLVLIPILIIHAIAYGAITQIIYLLYKKFSKHA